VEETAIGSRLKLHSIGAIEYNLVRLYRGSWNAFGACQDVEVGRVRRRAPLFAGQNNTRVKLGVLLPNPESHDVPLSDCCHGAGMKLDCAEFASAIMGSSFSGVK